MKVFRVLFAAGFVAVTVAIASFISHLIENGFTF